MDFQQGTLRVAAGTGIAIISLAGLRLTSRAFILGGILKDSDDVRRALLGAALLGLALGFAVVWQQVHALVPATAAVVLFALLLPLLTSGTVPTWYPEWIRDAASSSYNPATYLTIGFLVSTACVKLIEAKLRPVHGSNPV